MVRKAVCKEASLIIRSSRVLYLFIMHNDNDDEDKHTDHSRSETQIKYTRQLQAQAEIHGTSQTQQTTAGTDHIR